MLTIYEEHNSIILQLVARQKIAMDWALIFFLMLTMPVVQAVATKKDTNGKASSSMDMFGGENEVTHEAESVV